MFNLIDVQENAFFLPLPLIGFHGNCSVLNWLQESFYVIHQTRGTVLHRTSNTEKRVENTTVADRVFLTNFDVFES